MENERKNRFNDAYDYLVWRHIIKKQGDLALIMETSRSNISAALGGSERVLTSSFLQRFYIKFQKYFFYEWLMEGKGPMLKDHELSEKPNQSDEKNAEISIVSLAATLIKETEELRRQLIEEIEMLKNLRKELSSEILGIKELHAEMETDNEAIRSIRSQLSSILYLTNSDQRLPMAAENQEQ